MAPARQNHQNYTINNSNSNNNDNDVEYISVNNNINNTNNMRPTSAGANSTASSGTTTGAVPKTTTTAKRLATLIKQQMQQQQQQQQQLQHQRKNTEIVQPLQRELKTLNDFLLASVNRSRRVNALNQQPQQQQTTAQQDCTATNYDSTDNLLENPRSCFPVRPIQRVQHQQQTNPNRNSHFYQLQQLTTSENNTATGSSYATNATVGVVIPTTPNTISNNNNNNNNSTHNKTQQQQIQTPQNHTLQQLQQRQELRQQLRSNHFRDITSGAADIQSIVDNITTVDISELRQQFDLVCAILNLSGGDNSISNENQNSTTTAIANITEQKQQNSSNMVHETNKNQNERDIIVNSASLEDVALSEMSDNRAQSIQSLHSIAETPTPDAIPSYEELQNRLEASNRNMQNIQEKQAQLLRLQNAAKSHLSEMEQLRQQTNSLCGVANGSGDAPSYESLSEVQTDMASLVGRMKNLTAFIHHQNELGNILGDDGPELLAEQEELRQKLEALRTQRSDMQNLVNELQGVNRSAEQSAKACKARVAAADTATEQATQPAEPQARNIIVETEVEPKANRTTTTRLVPIELEESRASAIERAAATQAMINQKNNDIDALKLQMQRLKDMLATVNLIEERSETAARTTPLAVRLEREQTPINVNENEDNITRKSRALNKVTQDLRAEAASLQKERDRITELKAEIVRRQEQAQAAAKMGEDALKRNSLTPTPTPTSSRQRQVRERIEQQQSERDELKAEYEQKKKEYNLLCKRLEGESPNNGAKNSTESEHDQTENFSEADDEGDDTNDSLISAFVMPRQEFNSSLRRQLSTSTVVENSDAQESHKIQTKQQQQQQQRQKQQHTTSRQQAQNDDESNVALANSTIDGGSIDAASLQSGSNRSYFMPPPMAPMSAGWATQMPQPNLPGAWNSNYFYSVPPPPQPPANLVTYNANTATTTANEYVATLGDTAPSSTTSTAAAANGTDPLVIQQIVQTQQMLINSICQTNQTLWHQQREVDAINAQLHALQERVNNLAGTADINSYGMRSESVPPSAIGSNNLPNNQHYLSASRAQSEQPLPYGNAYLNYQQQQQQNLFQRHHQRGAMVYNYATDSSHQQHHNANSVYHAVALNNNSVTAAAAGSNVVPPASQQPTHFNNETPLSPHIPNSPGPIFMHHHNNTIHQNNANLRTQNQHANNLQQQQQQTSNQPTLNNQVPPGNRANNYWDNFRSYSRQNLLSINSNKSNEDQQQQQHLMQQPRIYTADITTSTAPPPRRSHTTAAYNTTNQDLVTMLQTQQEHLYETNASNNLNNSCNSSNNTIYNNKSYMNVRAQQQQQQQQQQQPMRQQLARPPFHLNVGNAFYENPQQRQMNNGGSSNCVLPTDSITDLNAYNMNLNFGNSPMFQRNKVLAKTAATSATLAQQQQQRLTRRRYDDAADDGTQFDDYLILHEHYTPPRTQMQRRTHDFNAARTGTTQNYGNEHFQLTTTTGYNDAAVATVEDADFMPRTVNATMSNNVDDNLAVAERYEEAADMQTTTSTTDAASDEINRNLLVNALKNDKFTTKFYESIKEDVFRRLESLFEQHEPDGNGELVPEQQQQISNRQLRNDVCVQRRDPYRKLYLNQQQQLQQQLQQKQQQQQAVISSTQQTDMDLILDDDDDDNNNAETESNKAPSESAIDVMQQQLVVEQNTIVGMEHNEKPEDEASGGGAVESLQQQKLIKADSTKPAAAQTQIKCDANDSSTACCLPQSTATPQTSNKKKTLENEEKLIVTVLECVSPPPPQPEIEVSPDFELIEYIIKRIRNQTHINTVINDTLLVEVSKLTANAAQNSATRTQIPVISPKRIYTKIKKMCIPRNRDEFLVWYQNYLEGIFIIEQHIVDCCKKRGGVIERKSKEEQQQILTNTKHATKTNGSSNHNQKKLNINRTSRKASENDADLAEADQKSAKNNITDDNEITAAENTYVKYELEFENNENPEEEGGSNAGACALIVTTTPTTQTQDKSSS